MGARTQGGGSQRLLWAVGSAGLTLALAWWFGSGSEASREVPAHAGGASPARASRASDTRPSLLEGALASALGRSGDAPAKVQTPDEGELTDIRDELQALEAQLASLRGEEADPQPAPVSLEEAMLRERSQTHASIERIQRQLESEARDPTWAPDAEEALRAAFELEDVWEHSRATDVECGQTLCRVRSSHDDSGAEMRALSALGHNDVFGSSEAFSERFDLGDGSIETETYITRRGHGLAPLLASR